MPIQPGDKWRLSEAEDQSRESRTIVVIFQLLVVVASLPLLFLFITFPLTISQQAIVSALFVLVAATISVLFPRLRLLVILLSVASSLRYIYWRFFNTLSLDNPWDASVSLLLFGAELYGVLVLLLGYFQTLELHRRQMVPLPEDESQWPHVDVFITTYNEDVEILRRTLVGTLAIDYSNKHVYLLDDGRRDSMRELAQQLGCGYITRDNNQHAKAGNINNALKLTKSEIVAIFDADHVPTKNLLRETVGFFTADPRLGLVQTPHHFYNPDPFERNLNLQGRIAPEGDFFYHVVEVGNDFWNSAFFCGSCGLISRQALMDIGGFATETVTEDAHTSMRIHAAGYRSVYYPKPLAAGLATERFAYYISQRVRWARGMVQILRVQNPLFTRGLKLPQRLNYFNAMVHFLFGIPRLAFIVAPLSYLLFGLHPIRGLGFEVLLYALPHIALSTIATSMVSRSFRHAFWAEVYETATSTYLAPVTLLALISPRLGKFNVTAKGGFIEKTEYDFRHASPLFVLIGFSLIALLIAVPLRWYWVLPGAQDERSSIAINAVWTIYNLVILVAAALVAREKPQQRRSPRAERRFPCTVILPAGEGISAMTADLSETGARIQLDTLYAIPETMRLKIESDFGVSALIDAQVSWREMSEDGRMFFGVRFINVDEETENCLTGLIFSGPESWTERKIPPDRPFRSYWYILSSFWRAREERLITSRSAPRVLVSLPCKVITDGGREFNATTLDLSELGASVTMDASAWPVPEYVHLQLRWRDGAMVDVRAQTLRPDILASGQLHVAMQFVQPSFEVQRMIASHIYSGRMAQTFALPAEDLAARAQQVEPETPTLARGPGTPTLVREPETPTMVQERDAVTLVHEPDTTAPGVEETKTIVRKPGVTEPIATYTEPLEEGTRTLTRPVQEVETIVQAPPTEPSAAEKVYGKIIANRRIGVYYVPGGDYYTQMLNSSLKGGPNWEYFDSEIEAQEAGYRRPRTIVPSSASEQESKP